MQAVTEEDIREFFDRESRRARHDPSKEESSDPEEEE